MLNIAATVSPSPRPFMKERIKRKKKEASDIKILTNANQKAAASVESIMTKAVTFAICIALFLVGLVSIGPLPTQEAMVEKATTTIPPKFFLALFLQYVDKDNQTNIYGPNMAGNDQTRLRVLDESDLKPDYILAAKNLPGPAGVTFRSSEAIINNAKLIKDLGFDFIEFNLEQGLSPSSDYKNVVVAMKRAADATHAQGLKFRATPSQSFTSQYGIQIAPYVDYYHIQAQSLQDNGITAYSDYVHTEVSKLRYANPNLLISVHVSTEQGKLPGLSLLETMEQCVDSVMDVADGVSIWYGRDNLDTLKLFVEWYNHKYS